MKHLNLRSRIVIPAIVFFVCIFSSCDKDQPPGDHYDLDVVLRGGKSLGYIKFRQDPNPEKIIDLEVKLNNLLPNHEYLLQRAVDAINVVDGNCTSTTWLTLGKGLVAQSILTDKFGSGEEKLWRDVTAIATGSTFDIHFQIVDAATSVVVLTSDCFDYKVR